MIIKTWLGGTPNANRFFYADNLRNVHVNMVDPSDAQKLVTAYLDLGNWEVPCSTIDRSDLMYYEITAQHGESFVAMIVCYETYLMNDNGKTIDCYKVSPKT